MASRNVPHKSDVSEIVWGFAALLALALIIYAPSLNGPFIWDDGLMVYNNPFVLSPNGLSSIWSGHDNDYYPLTSSVFWVEWRLFGPHPVGYRAVNVLLHVGSSVLLWRILKRIKVPGGLLAAFLYCVHPVCVETVAWVAELKNTLSVFLALAAVLLFLRARDEKWSPKHFWLALGVFVLALLSKISVVMLPVVLLALVDWKKQWVRTIPFFLASLILGLVNVWFQHHHAMAGTAAEDVPSATARILGGGYALWFYLGKILAPLYLIPVYPRWDVDARSLVDWLPVLLWIGALVLLWIASRRWRWARVVLIGLGCFTVLATPVLGFVSISFLAHSQVSDHLQYFPMIAIVAAAAVVLTQLMQSKVENGKSKVSGLGAQRRYLATALVAVLAFLTFQQARLYGDPEKLWRDNIVRNPKAAVAWANVGEILAGRNQVDESGRYYAEAVRLDPGNLNVREAYGEVLMAGGHGTEAALQFREILARNPNQPRAHNNLGVILANSGDLAQAIKEFDAVTTLDPDNEAAHVNVGVLLLRFGKIDEAIAHFQKALAINPQNGHAREGLAQAEQVKRAGK